MLATTLKAVLPHILQLGSLVAFCYGIASLLQAALSRGQSVGRQDILLAMSWIFIAAFLFDWSHEEFGPLSFLLSFFHAIQMATGNYDYQPLESGNALDYWCELYGLILVIAAPTSTIALVVTYMTDLLSALVVGFWSRLRDTFIFSQLDKRSLRLAKSIVKYYQTHDLKGFDPKEEPDKLTARPFIVFADVDNDAEEELASSARGMGAFCTTHEIEEVVNWCSNRRLRLSRLLTRRAFVTMLVTSNDEGQNISLAKRLDQQADGLLDRCRSYFRIFALTSLRNNETLLFDERPFVKPDKSSTKPATGGEGKLLADSSADERRIVALAKRFSLQASGMLEQCRQRLLTLSSVFLQDKEAPRSEAAVGEESQDAQGAASGKRTGERYQNRVIIRGFDNTRGVIEHVIDRYPIFLNFNPKSPWITVSKTLRHENDGIIGQQDGKDDLRESLNEELLGSPASRIIDRHIVIVGAGALGLEFVGSVLWASRIDGVHVRIDVLDHEENPALPGTTMAEERFAANSPEIMSWVHWGKHTDPDEDMRWYDLRFRLLDADGRAYQRFIEEHAATVTYVFIALGDDIHNAKVAMRTRQTLERELLRRLGKSEAYAKRSDTESDKEKRDNYLKAARPLILTFIENDELAGIVEKAQYEGQPCDITCVGRTAESFTYETLVKLKEFNKPEYNRRSSRASNAHGKYRLFAYLRRLWRRDHDVELRDGGLPVRADVLSMLKDVDWMQEPQSSWKAVRHYNRYCVSKAAIDKYNDEAEKEGQHPETEVKPQSHALHTEGRGDGKPCREWLLRMEHERWNAYMRVEGFEVARADEIAALFNTGQEASGKNLHRSSVAGLHPCLIPFDGLTATYHRVDGLYASHNVPKNTGNSETDRRPDDFALQDDKYLVLGSKEAFFKQEASDEPA